MARYWENIFFIMDFGESDDENEENLVIERKQHKMSDLIDMGKWDDEDFVCRFRLSKATVAHILVLIKSALVYTQVRSRYIRPIAQLLITLRFYALGSMQLAIGDFAGVSKASVCRMVQKVSLAIALQRPNFIKMPKTESEMISCSSAFYALARFPRTIGAIDCTHVKIQSPGGIEAEHYRNSKGWFSMNVQVVSTAEMKISNIVARWPGASHDQTIFSNSKLKMQFERGDFGSHILVADSGYCNTHYLATPMLQCETEVHHIYNESQIRTSSVIERLFGVLKRRFPVLAMGMRLKLQTIKLVIVACAVLHNIALDAKESLPPEEIPGLDEILVAATVPVEKKYEPNSPGNVRDTTLLSYFETLISNN